MDRFSLVRGWYFSGLAVIAMSMMSGAPAGRQIYTSVPKWEYSTLPSGNCSIALINAGPAAVGPVGPLIIVNALVSGS